MRLRTGTAGWLRANPFRVYFIVVALALLPLAVFLVAAYRQLNEQATTRLVTQAGQTGKQIGAQEQRHMQGSVLFLQSLALRSDLLDDWQSHRYEQLSKKLERVHALRPDVASLGIYDLAGTLHVVSPASPESLNQNFASRDWYGGVTKEWKPYVSDVYVEAAPPQRELVAVAVPVPDSQGKPVAILVLRETLDSVTREVYGMMSGPNEGLIFFVDRKGQIFGKKGEHVQLLPEMQPMSQKIGRPAQITSQRVSLNGRDFVLAYAPIASLQWGVLIRVPGSLIRAALWEYEKNLGLIGLIIAVLALGGGAIVAFLYRKLRTSEDRYLRQIEAQNRESELRRREAERANKMKSQALATISHELRTPLNSILGFSKLLQNVPELDVQRQSWVGFIHDSGRHLLQLVNDILDLSKISAGRLELHREPFVAADVIPEVTSTLAPLTVAKEINLTVKIEPDLTLHADRIRFKQILYNLLSNAVKFSEVGGSVRLTGTKQDDRAAFAVEDRGIGIRLEDQQVIFEEFSRIDEEKKHGAEGTGLGLAITKRLVEQHGGELTLESEPGMGSTFHFTLPLALGGEQETSSRAQKAS